MNCTGHRYHPQIWIACPDALRTAYGVPDSLWSDDWLKITVRANQYQPLVQNEGDRYVGGILFKRRVTKGFEIQAQISILGVCSVIVALSEMARCNNLGRNTFIEVRDYVQPERQDVLAAIANTAVPFTLRRGHIPYDLIRKSGVVYKPGSVVPMLSQGFRMTFTEYHPR